MTDESTRPQSATRRCVLLGAGVLGAAGVLTACSGAAVPYDANDAGQAPGSTPTTAATDGMASQAAAGASAMSSTGTTGTVLGAASEIPVGGGKIFTAAQVVVTQPTKGDFKAFSAVCTHVGCLCNQVSAGTIDCPCHGSKFKITDGSVVNGPATTALPAKTVTVSGGNIVLQ